MKKSQNLTLLAFMVALTTIFCFVPIPLPVPLGLMIVPMLVFAQVADFKKSVTLSIFLGLINYLAWFTTKAGSLYAPIFQNPLVCLIPRFMIGVAVFGSSWLLKRLLIAKGIKNKDIINQPIRGYKSKVTFISVMSTAVGVITNTGLVALFTLLASKIGWIKNTALTSDFLMVCFSINFVIEIICFSIIVPPIVMALRKAFRIEV